MICYKIEGGRPITSIWNTMKILMLILSPKDGGKA